MIFRPAQIHYKKERRPIAFKRRRKGRASKTMKEIFGYGSTNEATVTGTDRRTAEINPVADPPGPAHWPRLSPGC
jgi:hypothetical protein